MSNSDDGPGAEELLYGKMDAAVAEDVRKALRTLLETRFPYQSERVRLSNSAAEAERLQAKGKHVPGYINLGGESIWAASGLKAHLISYAAKLITRPWNIVPELSARSASKITAEAGFQVIAPPAELYCRSCKETKTHNSGALDIDVIARPYPLGDDAEQVFSCSYQCQSCRRSPVVYQITRRNEKLTITGCSEYPRVPVSRDVPEDIHEYISEAKVASATGRILAALFFLRTAVEQHMRKVAGRNGRHTGDELSAEYRKYLNDDFPQREWALSRIYEELSEKLHSADSDEAQYTKSIGDIERFFSVVRLYPLKAAPGDAKKTSVAAS